MNRLALGLCLVLASCGSAPLLHEGAPDKVQAGMTAAEVEAVVGPSYRKATYRSGTTSWTYKYRDGANIAKLLHVTFGPDARVLRVETEWDPDVYSKKR